MLLVTFHGGKSGIQNAIAYDTIKDTRIPKTALDADFDEHTELRGLVFDAATAILYVINVASKTSEVISFAAATDSSKKFLFTKVGVLAAASVSGGKFQTSIGHPYSLAIGNAPNCYISNQDTNTVALVQISTDGKTGLLPAGCQSRTTHRTNCGKLPVFQLR